MCLIIDRPAGIKFPEDKLENAIEQNSDGWGFAVFDRDKVEIIKGFDPNGTNPADVLKKMEELKDHRVILHIRFKTHGPKKLENCHPFPIWYDRPDNAYQVYLFHNGILSDFGYDRDNRVDSDLFGQGIVKPLLERSAMFMGDANCLSDPFAKQVMTKYAGSGNRLVLVDTLGNVLHINKESGTEIEGSWCSNNNYFTRWGRSSGNYGSGYGTYADHYKDNVVGKKGTTTTTSGARVLSKKGEFYSGTTYMKNGEDPAHYLYRNGDYGMGWYLKEAYKNTVPFDQPSEKTPTEQTSHTKNGGTQDSNNEDWPSDAPIEPNGPEHKTFQQYLEEMCPADKMLGTFHISQVTQFTREHIDELVELYPDMASALINDLIYELYKRKVRTPVVKSVPAITNQSAA